METITNAASSVVNTASNLIYGQPAKDSETTATTTSNETGGKEPLSGQQGKGTASEPFDQGNAENPVDTTSKTNTTSTGNDDFLKLSPALGKPANTESSNDTKTGTAGESSIPIVPLNPNAASLGGATTNTTSTETGITDKAGVTDKVWKPTALDEVKTEAAPGAGPSAPDYTVATPDLSSSTSNKASEPAAPVKDVAKDTTPAGTTHSSSESKPEPPKKESVGGDIDAILESTPKSKHTINDAEANDPHSKMTGKTIRQTDASQHGETENTKSLATEKTGTSGTSNTSADRTSSPASDEKSGKKMSELKDKLKNKLHIGHKDK